MLIGPNLCRITEEFEFSSDDMVLFAFVFEFVESSLISHATPFILLGLPCNNSKSGVKVCEEFLRGTNLPFSIPEGRKTLKHTQHSLHHSGKSSFSIGKTCFIFQRPVLCHCLTKSFNLKD